MSVAVLCSCTGGQKKAEQVHSKKFTGAKGEVKLITVDPGHFHAQLVQKKMYEQIDPKTYVYAPEGSDVNDFMIQINGFNTRAEDPTTWSPQLYTGVDFLSKMLAEKPGNVVVLSGNNAKKIDYILESAKAGLNVYADKPMVINTEGFVKLEEAFKVAETNGTLLYDIMTERFEITTIVQRELSKITEVFGTLVDGTPENPAITKESVHHFYKNVAGNAVKRPDWFFDTKQQGEGIVDVTTHLVDLIQWEAFPEVILQKSDVGMLSAKRWPTVITKEQFTQATRLPEISEFLKKDMVNGKLEVYANGEMVYKLKGKHAKVSVIWNYEAPVGTGDTHYSIMRGSLCDVMIKQGAEENYKPTVFVQANTKDANFEALLKKAVEQDIAKEYPDMKVVKIKDQLWTIEIPDKYSVGHEAHFGQVTEKYMGYLIDGKLPEWEVPNMIVKYYTNTKALELASK